MDLCLSTPFRSQVSVSVSKSQVFLWKRGSREGGWGWEGRMVTNRLHQMDRWMMDGLASWFAYTHTYSQHTAYIYRYSDHKYRYSHPSILPPFPSLPSILPREVTFSQGPWAWTGLGDTGKKGEWDTVLGSTVRVRVGRVFWWSLGCGLM